MEILLIEDDDVLGDAIRAGLAQEGYQVRWMRDGGAGGQALQQGGFDVVLLDLNLPNGSGLDLLKRLRALGNPTPVIILTARDTVNDRVRGLDAGADDYLVKPFDMNELYARVRAIARRVHGVHVAQLRHGELTLDLAAHTAELGDKSVELSPREFAVLRLFLENIGKVLTRKRVEDVLYGWDRTLASNAVEVHIHHLRRKLGSDFIRTLRGVGYMIPRGTQ